MLSALAAILVSTCSSGYSNVTCNSTPTSLGAWISNVVQNQSSGTSYAMFEAFPADGVGAGTACSCAAVTGARGEAMTFSRGSPGYCTKTVASLVAGIANGDLVECAMNEPRVMPGGDGTSVLGLGVWEVRVNLALRSADFANAAWVDFTAGAGVAPTRGAADTDTSPDGTTTSEQVTFAATGAADSSGLDQTILTAVTYSGSLYLRGNATTASGNLDLCLDTAASQSCTTCTFVLGSWTRCCKPAVVSKASGIFYIGNLSSLNGGTTRVAVTPTLWMGQAEAGATCSPPIMTAGTFGTRSADVAYFAVSDPGDVTGSMAATYVISEGWGGTERAVLSEQATTTYQRLVETGPNVSKAYFVGTVGEVDVTSGVSSGAHRLAGWWTGSGSSVSYSYDGTGPATGSMTVGTGVNRLYIGSRSNGTASANGVIKKVCMDGSSTVCR